MLGRNHITGEYGEIRLHSIAYVDSPANRRA